jgi:hypothetical protein
MKLKITTKMVGCVEKVDDEYDDGGDDEDGDG